MLNERGSTISSSYAEEEARRNILLKRPKCLSEFQSVIRGVTVVVGIDRDIPLEVAAKDRPILTTAIDQECSHLLTGDKRDFGHLFGVEVEGNKNSLP